MPRTTLTLEPDVARLIEEAMHSRRTTFKAVVNDAIRRGLQGTVTMDRGPEYRVRPHHARLKAGVDGGRLNALADELADDELLAKLADTE